jgi:hypothetical protein
MKFAGMLEQLSRSFLFAGTIGLGGGVGLIAWISQLVDAPILHDLAFFLDANSWRSRDSAGVGSQTLS